MQSETITREPAHVGWLAQERYRALQREAQACRQESATFETLCVGGVLAAYIWIARDADLYVAPADLLWFLPPVASFYGALRSQAIAMRLDRIKRDTAQIEQSLGVPAAARPKGSRRRWLAHRIAWIAFFALTVVASITGFEGGMSSDDEDDGQQQNTSLVVSRAPV